MKKTVIAKSRGPHKERLAIVKVDTKVKRIEAMKARTYKPKDESAVSHAVHELVTNDDERKSLLRGSHKDRVAFLKKNGYKFSK